MMAWIMGTLVIFSHFDPFVNTLPEVKTTYERIHFGHCTIRKTIAVANLSSLGCLPWLLYYRFAHDEKNIEKGDFGIRYFYGVAGSKTPIFFRVLCCYIVLKVAIMGAL